jgi:hypothetical protein
MTRLTQIVLDVLKPHHPTILDLGKAIAERCPKVQIDIDVDAVDEKTETILIKIEGEDIDFEAVQAVISELGASVHSIDRVQVDSRPI